MIVGIGCGRRCLIDGMTADWTGLEDGRGGLATNAIVGNDWNSIKPRAE